MIDRVRKKCVIVLAVLAAFVLAFQLNADDAKRGGRFSPRKQATTQTQQVTTTDTRNADEHGGHSGRFSPRGKSEPAQVVQEQAPRHVRETVREEVKVVEKTAEREASAVVNEPYVQERPQSDYVKKVLRDSVKVAIIQRMIDNMQEIEGGSYYMGATAEQQNEAYDTEAPMHYVTVSSFFIGRYEITQAEWNAVMDEYPSNYYGDDKDVFPVEMISWVDCHTFIDRLNEITGMRFRLPTEAEWEYAARGGLYSNGMKYAGGNNPHEVTWNIDNSGKRPHPVGTKAPNELGLYDMNGNVWEWCEDWYANDYYAKSNGLTDPKGPATGEYRIIRGGSWFDDVRLCRVSSRYMNINTNRDPGLGFRLAMDIR